MVCRNVQCQHLVWRLGCEHTLAPLWLCLYLPAGTQCTQWPMLHSLAVRELMWPAELMEIWRRECVLIYDNSYNMSPVTHYHPHQTTTKRKDYRLERSYNTDHTERDKVSQINKVCVDRKSGRIFRALRYDLKKYREMTVVSADVQT